MRKMTMAALVILSGLSPAAMKPVAAQQAATPREGRAVAEDVRKILAENYVVVDRRAALDKVLVEGIAKGRYDRVAPGELAERITADLQAVAHDKHLSLRFDPRGGGPAPRRLPGGDSAFLQAARDQNHGVHDLRVLPGNVRILNYTGFIWTGPESAEALDLAMRFLMGGDAAIIDLRGNGGGSPDAVRALTSYFVPPNTKLVTFYMRSDPPLVSSTGPTPPAAGLWPKDKPVYVLTGGRTASAGEEFASHVADFGFATLVGERTAGAAYRNEIVPLAGGFALSVSVGRPVLPSGGDWEGKGVAPKLAVPMDQAQARALQDAYTRLDATASPARAVDHAWLSAAQGALITPAPLARPAEAYAGRYGTRTIAVENGKLMYRRDGGLATMLLPIGPDLFALELDPLSHVHFTTDGARVTGFDLLTSGGASSPNPRGPAPVS